MAHQLSFSVAQTATRSAASRGTREARITYVKVKVKVPRYFCRPIAVNGIPSHSIKTALKTYLHSTQ